MVSEIIIDGKTQSLRKHCKDFQQNYHTVKSRIYKHHWSIKEALGIVPRQRPKKSIVDRLLNKIKFNPQTDCWEWIGCLQDGYGQIRINGQWQSVHRIVYEKLCGPISDDKPCVLHKCDNRKCCNPDHLYVGTHQDNMNDMVQRNRSTMGEKHPCAKLTEEQIIKIRESKDLQRVLAKQFNVSQMTISKIKNRKTWKHID